MIHCYTYWILLSSLLLIKICYANISWRRWLNCVVSVVANCILPCLNGGHCSAPYKCQCPFGFSGNRCERREYTWSHWTFTALWLCTERYFRLIVAVCDLISSQQQWLPARVQKTADHCRQLSLQFLIWPSSATDVHIYASFRLRNWSKSGYIATPPVARCSHRRSRKIGM